MKVNCNDCACKYILFTIKVIKIIEENEYPEYVQAEIIDAIEDFKKGELQ